MVNLSRMVSRVLVCVLICLSSASSAPLGKAWGPVPAEMLPIVEEGARNAIDIMGLRQLFNEGAIFSRVVSSSYLAPEGGAPAHFFILMDVDRGGETALVAVEAYKEAGTWKLLLPVPGKNRKETAPETLTSLTDTWIEIPTTHSLVVEAAPEAERLLVTYVFQAASSPPSMVRVLHAETRARDMATEMSHLIDREASSTQEVEEASASILKLQRTLVEKLSTKATALEAEVQGEDTTSAVAAVDSEISTLNAQIAAEETRQERSRASAERSAEALKLLQQQVEAVQNEVASGTAVAPSARSYLLMVVLFQEGGVSTATFKELVLMYKDSSGTWKLTHQEQFAV